MDSRVSIGVGGKGRSSSNQLNKRALAGLLDFLALDFYPGYMFAPTRLLPADDPSRFVELRKARQSVPSWVAEVDGGRYDSFDAWAVLPQQRRAWSEWGRIATKMCFAHNIRLCPKRLPCDST
jgi:hypothetical protein